MIKWRILFENGEGRWERKLFSQISKTTRERERERERVVHVISHSLRLNLLKFTARCCFKLSPKIRRREIEMQSLTVGKAYRADLKFLYETSEVEIGDLCLKFVILIGRRGDFTREDPLLWRLRSGKIDSRNRGRGSPSLSLSLSCSLSEDLPVSVYKVKRIRGQRSRRNCNSIFDFFILFIDGLLENADRWRTRGLRNRVWTEFSGRPGRYSLYGKFSSANSRENLLTNRNI